MRGASTTIISLLLIGFLALIQANQRHAARSALNPINDDAPQQKNLPKSLNSLQGRRASDASMRSTGNEMMLAYCEQMVPQIVKPYCPIIVTAVNALLSGIANSNNT